MTSMFIRMTSNKKKEKV